MRVDHVVGAGVGLPAGAGVVIDGDCGLSRVHDARGSCGGGGIRYATSGWPPTLSATSVTTMEPTGESSVDDTGEVDDPAEMDEPKEMDERKEVDERKDVDDPERPPR